MEILLVLALALAPCPARWHWPLTPPIRVLRGFTPPAVPWGPGHRGVDLAARAGQPVYAAGDGQVGFAGVLAGRGVIAITHGGALRTTYLPVTPAVRVGQTVLAGQRIGVIESAPSHCPPLLCLHWGLLRDGRYRDPLLLLCHPLIRLLPVWPRPYARPELRSGTWTCCHTAPRPPVPARSAAPAAAKPPAPGRAMPVAGVSEATGGAVVGVLLAMVSALLWGQFRNRRLRRLPPGVIDLAGERSRRRSPPTDRSPA